MYLQELLSWASLTYLPTELENRYTISNVMSNLTNVCKSKATEIDISTFSVNGPIWASFYYRLFHITQFKYKLIKA